jgi:hypothetical protein
MTRPYSEKFLLGLIEADPSRLGVQLGRLCIDANIPATHVARALEVSRMTVYSWFRGKGVSENKRKVVEVFMKLIEEDLERGVLPAKTLFDSKLYIDAMVGLK